MTYRPSAKDAKRLLKKSDKAMLPTIFTKEQAAVIQQLIDRQDKLEKEVAEQKKSLAEMKGQYNKLFAEDRIREMKEADRVILYEEDDRKSTDGADRPIERDDKGEE